MAIIDTGAAFARLKLKDLFVGHLTAFSPCKRMPTVGTLPRNGAAQAQESGSLDEEKRIVEVFRISFTLAVENIQKSVVYCK